MRGGWQPWLSTMATNAAIALIVAALIWFIGVGAFLLVHLPIMLLAALGRRLAVLRAAPVRADVLGRRTRAGICTRPRCTAARTTTCRRLLRWFTANIGMHHVHHLCSRIPYYRLPRVLRDHPELREIGRLTLLQSFRCVRLVLWDEVARSSCRSANSARCRHSPFNRKKPTGLGFGTR